MSLHKKADGRVAWEQGKPQVRLPKTSPWVSGGACPTYSSVVLHLVPVPSDNPEGLGSPGSDSPDSPVLPASSWSRSGEQAHTSPKMIVCSPPWQLHEDVTMGRWNHIAAPHPFHPTRCIQRTSTGGPAHTYPWTYSPGCSMWWQETKTKRIMAQKDGDKAGSSACIPGNESQFTPLGRRPPPIREDTLTQHPFCQCLCKPKSAIAPHHHQPLPLPGHPKCVACTWGCPRRDRLGSHSGQTGERCWYRGSSGGRTA